MYTRVGKVKKNKNRAVANSVTQKRSNIEPIFQLINNRLEVVPPPKKQEVANQQKFVLQKENRIGLSGSIKSRGSDSVMQMNRNMKPSLPNVTLCGVLQFIRGTVTKTTDKITIGKTQLMEGDTIEYNIIGKSAIFSRIEITKHNGVKLDKSITIEGPSAKRFLDSLLPTESEDNPGDQLPSDEEVKEVVSKVCEQSHQQAIEAVKSEVETKKKVTEPSIDKEVKKEQEKVEIDHPMDVGTNQLIINYVWIGDAKIDEVAKFNIFSWKALGHIVNIYVQRLDGVKATADNLGLEENDVNVIDLSNFLDKEKDLSVKGSTKEKMGDARDILIKWIESAKETVTSKEAIKTNHRFNMVDMTKSYIGATQRGIVLDLKVGPSEHLEDYMECFRTKFISYSRGGKACAGVENQSMGTMQENDELRQIYANKFCNALKAKWELIGGSKENWTENPNENFFGTLTSIHGTAFGTGKGMLGMKGMDVATKVPPGKEGQDLSVSEPGALGQGPFRVFKAAGDQTWEEHTKSITRSRVVKLLAQDVVKKYLIEEKVQNIEMRKKAELAANDIPDNMYVKEDDGDAII